MGVMQEVLICCSPADLAVAEEIGLRLEWGAEIDAVLEDSAAESVTVTWESGRSSAAVLLLLSPESVPPRADRTEWGALLDHAAANAQPPVGAVLVGSASIRAFWSAGIFSGGEMARRKF